MSNKVQCDTRVDKSMKEKLEEIAKALGSKRADIQRAAFTRYIAAFDAGEILSERVCSKCDTVKFFETCEEFCLPCRRTKDGTK